MADQARRKLERGAATGDLDAEASALAQRLRAGEVRRERLLLAAKLGHPEARAVLGLPAEPGAQRDLHALAPGPRVRVLIEAARASIRASHEEAWRDKQHQALVALESWARDPDLSRRPLVRDAVARTERETGGVDSVTLLLRAASQIVEGTVGAAPLELGEDVYNEAIREVFAWALGTGDPLLERAAERRDRAQRAWRDQAYEACGRLLFEPLRPEQRVAWAGGVLALCTARVPPVSPVTHLLRLAVDPGDWAQAYTAFHSLRELSLQAEVTSGIASYTALLHLAETTAKVISNASGEWPAFSHHRGWRIPARAAAFASHLRDPEFHATLTSTVLGAEAPRAPLPDA